MQTQAMRGLRAGTLMRVLLAAIAIAFIPPAVAAEAKPQAPGAPGDVHTWAPADKHGFGTAHDLDSRVWFTLRAAELTEAYYPDLGTPSLRDLEFAVTDGRSFIDRETDPGVETRVWALPGSLIFHQTTSTDRWRLDKTWIADPERDTVLTHVRFESLTDQRAEPLRARRSGARRRRQRRPRAEPRRQPARLRRHGREPDRRRAGAARTTSGYEGSASDPWTDLEDDFDLDRRYDADRPATSSRRRAPGSPASTAPAT